VFDTANDIAFWIVAFIAAVLVIGLMLVGYHDQQWKACAAYGKIARLRQNADTRKTIVRPQRAL
jgi:hypothetical protein